MWYCRHIWKKLKKINIKNSRGFSLIELLLSITTGFIVIICLSLLFRFLIKSNSIVESNNEILLNGRYALEYIKREIRTADMIVSSDKFPQLNEKYEDNIGFVIMKYKPDEENKYNYTTFYFKDNKIIRLAANTSSMFPNESAFSGHNAVAEHIEAIEGTVVDLKNRIIKISLLLEGKGKVGLELSIGIRCPVIY